MAVHRHLHLALQQHALYIFVYFNSAINLYVNLCVCINVDKSGGEDEAEASGGAVCPAAGNYNRS